MNQVYAPTQALICTIVGEICAQHGYALIKVMSCDLLTPVKSGSAWLESRLTTGER